MSNANAEIKQELVSVICRSIGRKELDRALQSVAEQTYPSLELVLVDAAACGLQSFIDNFPRINCKIVGSGEKLDRVHAANLGMESATGEWFLFLDDDDWIAEDHIASLIQALQDQSAAKAAYSNTQKTDASGKPVDTQFDNDFDRILLMRDNYIPIHAMVFHRSLFESGCRFDPQFDIYEDWDLWLQLSEHTDFLHVNKLTAFYREGGDSETDVSDATKRYRNDNDIGRSRAKLFDKWLKRWTGEQINALIGSLDQSELIASMAEELQELSDKLKAEHQVNLQHQNQIRDLLAELEPRKEELAQVSGKLEASVAHNEQLERQISELQATLQEIFDSTSWKLARPLRVIGRTLNSLRNKQSGDSEEKS